LRYAQILPVSGAVFIRQAVDATNKFNFYRAFLHVSRLHPEMKGFMATQHMQVGTPTLSSRHAAHARASLALASAMELDAQHLRGYGELSTEERDALDALADRLGAKVISLVAALAE
jgi:hypothetical protein